MAQFRTVAACFPVADIAATIAWYEEKLGFNGDPYPPDGPYVFGIVFRDNVEIMLQRIKGYQKPDLYNQRDGGVWDAYIGVEGIKELYESVREHVPIVKPLCKQFYGNWEFEVKDLNGYVLVFSEPDHG